MPQNNEHRIKLGYRADEINDGNDQLPPPYFNSALIYFNSTTRYFNETA